MKKRMKILLGLLLTFCVIAVMIPVMQVSAAKDPFSDVTKDDWFYDSVKYAKDNDLMNGMSDDTFEPQTTMSRAMVVTVLHRMEGQPEAAASVFTDVPTDTWFTKSVAWAAANGVVNGYSEDEFGPSDDVTREQIATILFRYADKKGYDISKRGDLSKYADNGSVSDWAKDALAWTNAESLVVGIDDNTLAPGANATRAQVATILQRFCEKYAKENEEPNDDPNNDPGKTEVKEYTVTFDYNYDNKGVYKTVKVKDGEKVGSVENPSRSGYSFSGWYTETTNGTKYDANKAVTENLKLYAHWTKESSGGGGGGSAGGGGGGTTPSTKSYTVTFDSNGGSVVKEQTVKENENATKPIAPTKEGYLFDGWFSDSELTKEYDFETAVTADITLYAGWEEDGEGLPKPANPTEADDYYWENSEKVLRVTNANESDSTLTEEEAISLMEDRGFWDYEVTYDFTIDGEYTNTAEAEDGKEIKRPMYQTYYVTESGFVWSIFIIEDAVMANPIFYNLESQLKSELVISESRSVTSYDYETNQFYINIPKDLGAIVKTVDRIDAETLDSLTIEEIDKL